MPWNDNFSWSAFNYAPLTVGVVLFAVWAWWMLGARNTFTGPVRQINIDDTGRVIEDKPRDEPADPTVA